MSEIITQNLKFIASIKREDLQERLILLVEKFKHKVFRPSTGYSLLALSALIAISQVFYVYYNIGDEGDTFTVGWLIANGGSLYKDIFSHHFPLAYLWVAAVLKLFGASIFAVRFSLILFRISVLAFAMRVSRYYLPLGLASLAWSLVGHLYLGNSMLYQSISGFLAVSAFAIGLAIITAMIRPQRSNLFVAGLLSGLSIMTDPLMILPAGILIATIAVSASSKLPLRKWLQTGFSRFAIAVLGVFLSISIILVYLFINGSLNDFYQSAILFNATVYSKYAPQIELNDILQPLRSFLDLFNVQWRYYLSPFYEWATFEFLDRWIFAGFFFRFSVVLGSVILLVERKFLGALLMYFYGAMLLVRSATFFHASPFVFFSFFCASFLISSGVGSVETRANRRQTYTTREIIQKGFTIVRGISQIIIFLAFLWLQIRGAKYLLDHKSELTFSRNFAVLQGNAGFLRKTTCSLEEARVLVYPLDPMQYFLAEIPPASKYHFMTPWVAEVGLDQVISDLDKGRPQLIFIDRDASIWGYPVEQYLGDLINFLDEQYVPLEPGYYASPDLFRICPYATNDQKP